MTDSNLKPLLVAVAVFVALAWFNGRTDGPTPEPSSVIADAVADGVRLYAGNMADTYEGLAADLRAGQFATDSDFREQLEERAKTARVSAYTAFRAAFQQGQPDEWDAAGDAKRCDEAAVGFRRASKWAR